MLGNVPDCGGVPPLKHQNINILGQFWLGKSHIEIFIIILLEEFMQCQFSLYDASMNSQVSLASSLIVPLRKHPLINIVKYHPRRLGYQYGLSS